MRILGIAIFILVGYVVNAYAENELTPILEPKTETIDQDAESRLTDCEREIRELRGRVEVLEHSLGELQKTHIPTSRARMIENSHTTADTAATDTQGIVTDNSAEKREYDLALAALKDSKFDDAEKMFESFIQKYPSSSLISNAYFWYAETFYRRGEFDKAAVHYLKGYKQFPKASKAADSLFKLALSLGEIKKPKEACAILHKLEEEFKERPASSIKRAYDAKMKYGCK